MFPLQVLSFGKDAGTRRLSTPKKKPLSKPLLLEISQIELNGTMSHNFGKKIILVELPK